MDVVVFGNSTLDIICLTIDDVPRYESISFDNVAVMPGGCGSNVAIGLSKLGISTGLICYIGNDAPGRILKEFWDKAGVNPKYIKYATEKNTAVSIGLVDSMAQPRFIHTPGANALLSAKDLEVPRMVEDGAKLMHVGGYFVLPGIMDENFPKILGLARSHGIMTSLDVVRSVRMADPSTLWPCMPELDIFLCNKVESYKLSGEEDIKKASKFLINKGAKNVVIKLGAEGCWVESQDFTGVIPAPKTEAIDTTGAGDAFAAGLIAGLIRGKSFYESCRDGNNAGAKMVTSIGAVGSWFNDT